MRTLIQLLAALSVATSALKAATVVTVKERISGTIIAQDDRSLTLRLENRLETKISRDQVLQIFDDKGDLVWQAALPPEVQKPPKPPLPLSERRPGFAPKSIILDFYVGTALGGFYSEENAFIDSLGIFVQYSDGSRQTAKTNMFVLGGGASYQWYTSMRWSNLVSYVFRSTSQTISTGDGSKYEKNTLASQTTTTLHALLFGKEVHFYPTDSESSIDIIGQVGYEFGNYKPLASYNEVRTKLTPIQPMFNVASSVTIHGPTARVGSGITFRGTNWQFRLLAFYQIAYTFASEQIWTAVPANTATHDIYAGISLGYGW